MKASALMLALLAALMLLAAAALPAARAQEGESSAVSAVGTGGEGGAEDMAPVQDSTDGDGESSEESSEASSGEGEGAESSSEDDGHVTIIENANHLNALAEKKKYDEATEAKMHEEKLKRDQEEHKKKMDAFNRQQRAEQNLKSEQDLKHKTKLVEERQAKQKVREEKEKQALQAKTEKAKEEGDKRVLRARQAALRKEQEARGKGNSESVAKARAHKARKAAIKRHHKNLHHGKAIALRSGWRNYGGSYATATYTKWGNICSLEGLIRGSHGLMAQLPGPCRPVQGRLIFVAHRSREHRVDVLPDGRVYRITGYGHNTWTSLSGITFDTHRRHNLWTYRGWRAYGHGYRHKAQTYVSGLCVVSGLIRSGHWNYMGRTMSACYPGQQLIFSGNNHHRITRLDVRRDGYIFRNGGYHSHGWVSLDGLVYARRPGSTMRLHGPYRHYGHGYRHASYNRIGRLCVLGGLVRNSNRWTHHIATLPKGCRPGKRLIFGANVHSHDARVDVLPDGRVLYINRRSRHGWLSLSNIRFVARG